MDKSNLRHTLASVIGRFLPILLVRIPPELQKRPLFMWRLENIVVSIAIAIISLPLYAAFYYQLGDAVNAKFCLAAAGAAVAVAFLLRLTGNLAIARETFTGSLFLLILGLSIRMGGASAPTIPWFAICPIIAMTAGGFRPGLVWSALAIVATVGMYLTDSAGMVAPVTATNIRTVWLVSACGYFPTIALTLYLFEVACSNAIEKLDMALATINTYATTDDLTGILNRRESLRRADLELIRVEQQGLTLCVCLIDLDHFKQINDTHGHGVGDAVLRRVSWAMQHEVREADVLGRYGGEEFLLLLAGVDASSAIQRMDRIRCVVAQMDIPELDAQKHVTISVGISEFNIGITTSDLIARADKALYQAKHEGRNKVVFA